MHRITDAKPASSRALKLHAIALCLLFVALVQTSEASLTAQTPDINKAWTTVGSAGTVDEADIAKVFFDHAIAQMGRLTTTGPVTTKRAIVLPIQSAVIRYNITAVDGLFFQSGPCQLGPGDVCKGGVALTLRYLDTGNSARVVARLVEVNTTTGGETTRLTFDSNNPTFSPSNQYQVRAATDCGPTWRFDFVNKAYYVEAALSIGVVTNIGTASGIQTITIGNAVCQG
jgi:hypothetical protein